DISPPNWGSSVAIDINNNGFVVGNASNGGTPSGFFYSGFFYDGAAHDMNAFPEIIAAGWSITGAYAINDSGQIVGVGINNNGQTHAYRMHPQSMSRYVQPTDSTGAVNRARYY